ncbi:MAG: tetraacyldisaccharide 4'-kinase [Pyrinomonadaceae bacterium]
MASTPTAVLAPLSALYGAAVRGRLALYRSGVLRSHRIGVPVISVGNITAGGTGKTPLVQWVVRALAREGRRVCVLSRGYGRENEGRRVLVSDGERVLADARAGGDEPRLLAESLLGVAAVVCDADRVAAARWAIDNLSSEAFVLDDAFQHLRIERDLNIVTVDALDPWGGGRLLPRGRLREPLSGLRRADCVVITRAELARDLRSLRDEAKRLSGGRPVFAADTRTARIGPLDSAARVSGSGVGPMGNHPSDPLAAFCALGNPQAFFVHARNIGLQLTWERAFLDHHAYTQEDVDALVREAARRGAGALLTTAKDAVKLRGLAFTLPCYVLEIELAFEDEARMIETLRSALLAEQ